MSYEIELLIASENGDVARVEQLLTLNVDVNAADNDGNTCLHVAAVGGHQNVIELLNAHGADLFAKNKRGDSLLIPSAFSVNRKNLVNYLMEKGLKFDSIIHETAFKGDLDGVKKCVNDLNIVVNTADTAGNTALHYAAVNGQINVVQWLAQEGKAKITKTNNQRETALFIAAKNGHTETVKWLLLHGGAKITEKDYLGFTALLRAALNGHTETVKWLLLHGGAKITEKNNQNQNVLNLAETPSAIICLQTLLQMGAGINATFTANQLQNCNLKGCIIIGMKVDGQPITRQTPLPGCDLAITNIAELRHALTSLQQENRLISILPMLLKIVNDLLKVDLNNEDLSNIKRTLYSFYSLKLQYLSFCANYRDMLNINVLTRDLQDELNLMPTENKDVSLPPVKGADPKILQYLFRDKISEDDIIKIIAYIEKHHNVNIHEIKFANGDTLLHLAVKYDKENLVSTLCKLKFNLNAQNDTGDTACHYTTDGNPEIVNTLIIAGAKIDIRNNDGITVIDRTIFKDQHDGRIHHDNHSASLLTTAFAHKAINPKTPLGKQLLIQIISDKLPPEILRAYILSGAEVNPTADVNGVIDGQTPLYQAVISHNIPAIRLLLLYGADPNYKYQATKSALELCKGWNIFNLFANAYTAELLVFESNQRFEVFIKSIKTTSSPSSVVNLGSALKKAAKADIELTRMLIMEKLNSNELTPEQKTKLFQIAAEVLKDFNNNKSPLDLAIVQRFQIEAAPTSPTKKMR